MAPLTVGGWGMPSIRPFTAVMVAALSLSGGGCTLIHDSICINAYRMKEAVQDCFESKRDRRWAEEAWANVRRANPQVCYSDDYGIGYRDGFAHFLYRGGSGEPPPLPPKEYRGLKYQTPQGYKAIEDWFAGFRHGAADARAGGYRRWVTGPASAAIEGPPADAVILEPTAADARPAKLPAAIGQPTAVAESAAPPPATSETRDTRHETAADSSHAPGSGSRASPMIATVGAPEPVPHAHILRVETMSDPPADPAAAGTPRPNP